jgi:hypothetical protein
VIIAAFDSLLDEGGLPPLFLDDLSVDCPPNSDLKTQFVSAFIREYFRILGAFSKRRGPVHILLEDTIRRMYKAEMDSNAQAIISRRNWWRKNVLPVIVMGTPVWLAGPAYTSASFRQHLLWLSRVGEFLGWVDDFADYSIDRISGHANRLCSVPGNEVNIAASRVARLGRRVLAEWDARNQPSPSRDAFVVMVSTWSRDQDEKPSCSNPLHCF